MTPSQRRGYLILSVLVGISVAAVTAYAVFVTEPHLPRSLALGIICGGLVAISFFVMVTKDPQDFRTDRYGYPYKRSDHEGY